MGKGEDRRGYPKRERGRAMEREGVLDGKGRGSGRYARDEVSPSAWRTSSFPSFVVVNADSRTTNAANEAATVSVVVVVVVVVVRFHGACSASVFGERAPGGDRS